MTGLWIACLILLLFLLVLQLRLRVILSYQDEGPKVAAGVGFFRILLYPRKEKPPKLKKPKRKKKKTTPETERKGVSLTLFWELLPILFDLADRLKRKIRIDNLELDLTWGAEDPADAAMEYGYANAAIGTLLPLLEAHFMIKDKKVRISLDYGSDKPRIYARASSSLTLYQMLSLGLYVGVRGFKLYKKYRRTGKVSKKAVQS